MVVGLVGLYRDVAAWLVAVGQKLFQGAVQIPRPIMAGHLVKEPPRKNKRVYWSLAQVSTASSILLSSQDLVQNGLIKVFFVKITNPVRKIITTYKVLCYLSHDVVTWDGDRDVSTAYC